MKRITKNTWVMDALSQLPFSTKAMALKRYMRGSKKYISKKKTCADMDAIIKCALCPNMCKFDCPVLQAEKNEAVSPSGKMRLAYLLEAYDVVDTDTIARMYDCVGCDSCKQWCPFDYSVNDILRGVRKDIARDNRVPDCIYQIRTQLREHNYLGERLVKREEKKGEVLYFAGCSVLSKRGEE